MNTSGKHFQRMCAARKSTTGCYAGGTGAGSATPSSGSPEDNQMEANNLDDNVQTVSRRSRSRKVRGKRRNTIAGIDQKEIQDAANGYVAKERERIREHKSISISMCVLLSLFHSLSDSQTVNKSHSRDPAQCILLLYTLHLYFYYYCIL